jgi:hypothetical protein
MFVVIAISSAGTRRPSGAPVTSLDEAKCIAVKLLDDDKIKGSSLIQRMEVIDKTGKPVFTHTKL